MITEKVIGEEYAFENLTRIFPSSIILKTDYQILATSDEIEQIFNYSNQDLVGNNILLLMQSEFPRFQKYTQELIKNGYFMSKPIYATNKFGEEVYIKLSGFYLGLLSEMNDILVIMITDLRHIKRYRKQIKQRESEFNELVYRTHHEIKGPIATIKGLLNIFKNEKDSGKVDDLIELINQSITVLDERVTNIAQFHELNSLLYDKRNLIDLKNIEDETRKIIANHSQLKNSGLNIKASDIISLNISGEVVHKLMAHLVKAISYFKVIDFTPQIMVHFSKHNANLKVNVELSGFFCNPDLRGRLERNRYCIEDAIKEDSILRFYITYNHVINLDGKIFYTFLQDNKISCEITIPI